MTEYESWGRFPKSKGAEVLPLYWVSEVPKLGCLSGTVLARGKGSSYGDCCLNDGGTLLDTLGMNRFIRFDRQTGILMCEAGTTLGAILDLIVPAGWFLPVSPGTQFVTVGGAIANDVHGKNHHRAGTFGCHVRALELLRSDGERIICSLERNMDLFRATIGGLGLTGLILRAEFQLKPVSGPWIDSEQIRFRRLEEFFELSADADKSNEYTVAWIDCISGGEKLGRGVFFRGNHSSRSPDKVMEGPNGSRKVRGFDAPEALINRATVRAFNSAYFHRQFRDFEQRTVHFQPFFYPLDSVAMWNRFYGERGFLQYQFVVPHEKKDKVREILKLIDRSRLVCSLAVLKVFGEAPPAGMLSFPKPGVTLALDFPFQGQRTLDLCSKFDELVQASGGAVYPAKDSRMSMEAFQSYFPNWLEFTRFQDPHFSSNFWRRTAGTGHTVR